jgi:hypothetical protein
MSDDPYASQTKANTDKGWLADEKPVDVKLGSLVDFAKQTEIIRGNVHDHLGYLSPLVQLPNKAWSGPVLGEAVAAKSLALDNYREFMQYARFLQQALYNVGSAAQTIADIYNATDRWAAADLNAVKWALGDQSVPRPAGAPPGLGKTWLDAYLESMKQGDPGAPAAPEQWTDLGETHNADGSITQTAVLNGQTRKITTWNDGGVTKVKVEAPDGTVTWMTTASQWGPGNSRLENTVVTVNGKVTGSTLVTNSSSSVTTSHYDGAGHETSRTVAQTDVNGSVTETNTSYDAKGAGKVTSKVTTGPQTPGQTHPDTPDKAAQDDIKAHGAN